MSKPYSLTLTQPQVMAMALEKFKDQYGGSLSSKLLWWLKRFMFFARSWFFDLEYHTMPIDILKQALEEWRTKVLPHLVYEGEVFDCDDFARHFEIWIKDYITGMGIIDIHSNEEIPVFNGVGLGLGYLYQGEELLGGHAWNIVLVTKNGEPDLIYVEPQIGEIVDNNSSSDKFDYELMAVII